jgi:hypothetical protein
MKTLALTAALAAAALLIVGPALAQDTKGRNDCQPSASASGSAPRPAPPEKIEGQVTKVDPASGMLTIKRPDGTTHEFRGSAETVKDYKPGDQIELTLRSC